MYRPTVRYADDYKQYIDSLFRVLSLDRNQIIRAALFVAAHSKEFEVLLSPYKRSDVPLPPPSWEKDDHGLWLEQSPKQREEGRDVNGKQKVSSRIEKADVMAGEKSRRIGEVRKVDGRIKVTF